MTGGWALWPHGSGKAVYLDESTMLYRQHGGNSVGAKRVSNVRDIAGKLIHIKALYHMYFNKKYQA